MEPRSQSPSQPILPLAPGPNSQTPTHSSPVTSPQPIRQPPAQPLSKSGLQPTSQASRQLSPHTSSQPSSQTPQTQKQPPRGIFTLAGPAFSMLGVPFDVSNCRQQQIQHQQPRRHPSPQPHCPSRQTPRHSVSRTSS